MDKLVIIDGNSLINRAFYALPLLSNKDGEYSNAVFGFATMLIKTIEEHRPTHLVVAFDYGKKTFRHNLYAEYKGKRKGTPEELKSQFPILKRLLTAMNIQMYEKEGIEADDIIGTLSHKYKVPTIIVTGDKDALQLIDDTTEVWLTKKGLSEVKLMNNKTFHEEYGFDPIHIIDLKALMGDNSDNIPGVPGVGEKTAMTLIQQYSTVENVYAHIEDIKGKLREKLEEGKDSCKLSKTLATIDTNVDITSDLSDFTYDYPFDESVRDIFVQYQFNSLLKREELFKVGATIKEDSPVEIIEVKSIDELTKVLANCKKLALHFDNARLNIATTKAKEYVIDMQPDLFGNGLNEDEVIDMLKPILESSRVDKIFYDSKEIKRFLLHRGIDICGKVDDISICGYLCKAGDKAPKWPDLAVEYGLNASHHATNLIKLKDVLYTEMDSLGVNRVYNEIELPLVDVLLSMEEEGFTIDKQVLVDLRDRYSLELDDLTKVIYSLAGHEFNINSPKQLGEVLFDDLGLVAYNNKKKSTGIEILEELEQAHPIVPLIIRYRKIMKLKNTYLDSYIDILGNNNKIHTVFNQTLTATGRLSSSEPNLQNIPVRDEEGKVLRKMFVPSTPDGYLVDADYSQIELRLLAEFSEDQKLVEAYKHGQDIHAQTASEVFGVPFQEVTPLMRRNAKAVNFGIIYGISDFGLAQNIGCTRKEAKAYIERYFERYPGVKEYMNKNVEFAKKNGYISTMFGRIRKINELKSPNYMTRQFGERVSMNTPLQGSASDIIKLAMIKVYDRLKRENLKSRLILQIHDELIIDTVHDELGVVSKIIKEEMENAVKTRIPLEVSVSFGKDWFSCK